MGKQPEALRRYWASKRRKTKGKIRTVVKVAKKKYFGRRRGGRGRTKIPIVPCLAGAALGLEILAGNTPTSHDNALQYIQSGRYDTAALCVKRQLTTPQTYLVPVGIVLIDGVLRMLMGRVPLGKRATLL